MKYQSMMTVRCNTSAAITVIERITAIISQNGNMYEEGLGKKWEARKAYWKNPTPELRQQFSSAFALETIIGQYTFGTPEGSVGPDGYSLDYYYVNLPGRAEMQNDLISRKPSYGNCAADERILKASS